MNLDPNRCHTLKKPSIKLVDKRNFEHLQTRTLGELIDIFGGLKRFEHLRNHRRGFLKEREGKFWGTTAAPVQFS